jgi:hypothetical protein
MLHPIYQKNDTYFKFLSSNSWISEYLPNISINEVLVDKKPDELSLIDLIENFLMFVQIKIMKVRTGAEILNKNIIHFLKIDHSQRILDSFSKMKS